MQVFATTEPCLGYVRRINRLNNRLNGKYDFKMNKRNVIIGAAVLLGLIGTALGVVYIKFVNLPHPKEASHNQLMYWVVMRDLKDHNNEVQLALVDRFAAEAKEIFSKSTSGSTQLSKQMSDRLLSNIELLKRAWFVSRIDAYCKIESNEVKEAYLDKQIRLLDDFGNIAFENAKVLYPDKADENLTTISDELFADIDLWLNETPPEKTELTLQAVREATVFWLTTQDLSIQAPEARQELAQRVIAELDSGMDLSTTTSIVSSDRAAKLKQNSILLMEGWFHTLATQYDKLEKKKRNRFVDEKIQCVKKWKLLEFLSNDESSVNKSNDSSKIDNAEALDMRSILAGVTKFNKMVETWTKNAGDKLGPKINNLHKAIQRRMLLSFFN